MSTEPRPIKVTSVIISSNEKSIENTKTGKVTAVVAVMYLDKKINQICIALIRKKARD